MFRFMAFIWDASDVQQCEAARFLVGRLQRGVGDWRKTTSSSGLAVFCTGARPGISEPYLLDQHAGVVLGTLFERQEHIEGGATPRRAVLGPQESAAVLESRGRQLTTHYWGRYVAFLFDPASSTKWVIRDPSGFLPCFSAYYRGVAIFFSAAEDCISLNVLRFSINWNYVTRRVAFGPVGQNETALHEVSEVRAGECVELCQARASRKTYWRLLSVADADPIDDAEQAARELRSTIEACVHAWASCYRRIVHKLSGGLDSSIVLGCLNGAPVRPEIVCLKYYLPYLTFDERPHARLAADRAGSELVESEMGESIKFRDLLRAPRSINPYPHLAFLATSETDRKSVV